MTRESKILIAILVVVVGGMIGLFALANQGTPPAPKGDASKLIRDNSHKTGTGTVQIVEFGDFQCPACAAAHPHMKQLLQEYDGKVSFYFRNFPLTNIHPNALVSAQAAEAAGDQGKYWEMHNKLFESQKEWEGMAGTEAAARFADYAGALGLDVDKFKTALSSEQFKTVVDQDLADATALELQSTPTFFFNGAQHRGQHDYASLRSAIETALQQQTPQPQTEASPQASPAASPQL